MPSRPLLSVFTALTLLILSLASLTTSSALPPTPPPSTLSPRMSHFKLRNMNFCTFTFNQNQCVVGTHYVEATQLAEIYIFNWECNLIGWSPPNWPTTRKGQVVNMDSRLPNVVVLTIDEWWPTFDYEGRHYGNPTCVEDSLGGASGCWQTFECEPEDAPA